MHCNEPAFTTTCLTKAMYNTSEEAVAWSKKEFERFRDFLALSVKKYSPETAMVILQDGGELCDKPLSDMPEEVWVDFQNSFLN